MNFISVKETADRWNISTRRVVKLAKEGRIKGSVFISSRWLIPENAEKPRDNRKKASYLSEDLPENDDSYRFPLFYYSVTAEEYRHNSFSYAEKRLLTAILHYERFELTECITILEELLPETDNRYTRISIQYFLLYSYHDSCNYEKAVKTYHQLMLSVSQAGHQDELSLVLREVKALFDGARSYADPFYFEQPHEYSKDFLIYFAVANILSDASSLLTDQPRLNIASHEITCRFLENQQYEYAAIIYRLYLSLIYSFAGNEQLAGCHIAAAFNTAENYRLYSTFLYLLGCHPNCESIIKAYSSEKNIQKLMEIAEAQKKAHKGFIKFLGKSTLYLDLSPENHKYLSYSMKGYTTEKMAEIENSSLYNVKKNLKELYRFFKVDTRNEVVNKLHDEMIDFYQS